jgi:hypothetical protein
MAAANVNMRFKTNDLISTDCQCWSRFRLNLDTRILFLCVQGGQFQNIEQLDNTEK